MGWDYVLAHFFYLKTFYVKYKESVVLYLDWISVFGTGLLFICRTQNKGISYKLNKK